MKSKKYVKWSKRELNILEHWYPREGLGVQKRLKRRSKKAISSKAYTLGLTSSGTRRPWKLEEELMVAELYETEGTALSSTLDRSRSSVLSKAKEMQKKSPHEFNNFTEEEMKILSEQHSVAELCELLPRHTANSIIRKRMDIGQSVKRCNRWSDEEIKILEEYYPKEGALVIHRLHERTKYSVRVKAAKMGIKCNGGL